MWSRSWVFGQVNYKSAKSTRYSLHVTGFALGGTSVPENQLQPFIDQAVDQASIYAD